ncbi:MAG: DUF3047 domain-containing protein [Bacteroidota bacterium]|nr:DUF3047 domain-containing protein [Kiloniellaceae bacterium]
MILSRFAVLSVLILAGCAAPPQLAREGSYDRPDTLFDPARAIEQDWTVMPLAQDGETRATDYHIASYQDRLSIRAEGQRSATGLALAVDIDVARCPYLEWDWRVERLQEGANPYERALDDAAASILVMFGDPGELGGPQDSRPAVPTLRYLWTIAAVPEETIIDSPSQPGILRSIVVQGGVESPLAWESERRDVEADYQAAFGSLPKERVRAVVLFTDNDQTQEPVIAHYGPARLLCGG